MIGCARLLEDTRIASKHKDFMLRSRRPPETLSLLLHKKSLAGIRTLNNAPALFSFSLFSQVRAFSWRRETWRYT